MWLAWKKFTVFLEPAQLSKKLYQAFLPGPLTIILKPMTVYHLGLTLVWKLWAFSS